MKLRKVICGVVCGCASTVTFGGVLGVQNVSTNLDSNGDRQFLSSDFAGSSTVFSAANAGLFADGTLTNNVGAYGWNDPIASDLSSSNHFSGNPDRADFSTPFASEGSGAGTLAEIFGVNNLSHIIDGEDNGAWTLDLLFASGQHLIDDGDGTTPEFLIFERGGNSKIGLRGIYASGSGQAYTSGIVLDPSQFTDAGWKLDSLEIDGKQKVVGAGVSIDDLGVAPSPLIGIQVFAQNGFNGPDLVGVLSSQPIPEPASIALVAIGGLLMMARRRA